MDRLATEEKKKYELLWGSFPEYRKYSPADILTSMFIQSFYNQFHPGDTVIDFGCGPGRSAPQFLELGLSVHLVDLCSNCLDPEIHQLVQNSKVHFFQECLWNLSFALKPAEWFVCFDVLEHLPLRKISAALQGMALHMKTGGFLSIALYEDHFRTLIDQKLHLTVKPADWWKKKLQEHFFLEHSSCVSEKYLIATVRKRKPSSKSQKV